MLSFLPPPLLGLVFCTLIWLNTLLAAAAILLCSPLKLLAGIVPASARPVRQLMERIQERWTANTAALLHLLPPIRWDVRGLAALRRDRWYFVLSNHQAWMDIITAFHVLNRRVPPLKIFIKQELLYVPLVGLAVQALDYPFMKRYSRELLKRKPHLRGKDLETTRRACAKYRHYPVSVLNYMEGTRLTPAKHARQASPYRHLLKPKSAGAAFVLNALGERMDCLLDLTIVYPDGAPSFWDLCCGRVRHVIVDVRLRDIPPHFCTASYEQDVAFRQQFHAWVAGIWQDKDRLIAQLTATSPSD